MLFPMSPLMSWILLISLALLIAVPLTLMHRGGRRRAAKAAAQPEHLAIVTELRPRTAAEPHLAAVPELREVENSRRRHLATKTATAPSTPIYDWATQGV